MARLIIEVKDKTKAEIIKQAEKKGITYRQLILEALGVKDA